MVACDAGPIIWLSRIGKFELLLTLFREVAIAPEVYAETVTRSGDAPNAALVQAACRNGWMRVIAPQDAVRIAELRAHLHGGEAETLVLAHEQAVEAVPVDD